MENRHRRILVLGMVALGCFAALRAISVRRALAGSESDRDRSGSIKVGGRTREYIVHVPRGYDGKTPLPLVFVLHGGTQSPESAERMSGMSPKADKENFIAVYPRGTGLMPTWNSGNCCGYALREKVDDVGFLRALIEKLAHDYSVDPKRIFATGISNGGMMSYRAACEMADQIAAIAPVEGAQNVDCRPSAPVSLLVFHGTADRLVSFDGGTTKYQLGPKRTDNSVAGAVTFWVKQDGCSPAPQHEKVAEASIDAYSGCKDGTGVTLYAINGGRHMWPGHSLSGNHVAATDILWTFFSQHPKP
jgi:polyhydroxybutyrate depolymerase